MIYKELEEIARQNRESDPDNAQFYTVEWARAFCERLNKSPAEYLEWSKAKRAELAAIDWEALDKKAEEMAKENPEFYAKMTGPIDGFSYGLMLKSGEIKEDLSRSDDSEQ